MALNEDGGKITFIAEIEISQLRALALCLLRQLGDGDLADRHDGIDPVEQFDGDLGRLVLTKLAFKPRTTER